MAVMASQPAPAGWSTNRTEVMVSPLLKLHASIYKIHLFGLLTILKEAVSRVKSKHPTLPFRREGSNVMDRLIKWCMTTLASHFLENTEASNITPAQGGPVIRDLKDRVRPLAAQRRLGLD
jgi:hypothetical protein